MLHTYQHKRKSNKATKKHHLPSFNYECQQKHKELRKVKQKHVLDNRTNRDNINQYYKQRKYTLNSNKYDCYRSFYTRNCKLCDVRIFDHIGGL